MFLLGNTIRDNDLIQRTGIDPLDSIATQHAVRQQRVDFGGALLLQQLGRARDGVGGVGEVVDEDADPVGDVADEHHGCVLAVGDFRRAAFLLLAIPALGCGFLWISDERGDQGVRGAVPYGSAQKAWIIRPR